jgi:hypothetical protein
MWREPVAAAGASGSRFSETISIISGVPPANRTSIVGSANFHGTTNEDVVTGLVVSDDYFEEHTSA